MISAQNVALTTVDYKKASLDLSNLNHGDL